jgi:hypothetical protein
MMDLSWNFTLLAMQHHFLLKAVYISTADNASADVHSLSL